MSFHAVHSGTGYQYLLRSVATNDAAPDVGLSGEGGLSNYYAAKGTPPGRWLGSGIDGLQSATVRRQAVVEEAQMAALYGEGLHPDADARMRAGESLSEVKLGRAFPNYTGDRAVLEQIAQAERQIKTVEERLPTEEERSDIALAMGKKFYPPAQRGEEVTGEEVIAWVNAQRDQERQAVAGFDMTFSPSKSVSVMWALADEKTSTTIAAIHHEAVADAMAHVEDQWIFARQGKGGIEQVKTNGLIASEFTHFDTRGGDPDLHSHVLVANKVQTADGKWLSVDSNALYHAAQSVSAYYDVALHDRLEREMGVEFTPRETGKGKDPVYEIAGIDDALIDKFSSRRELARPVYDEMVADYMASHGGTPPSERHGYELWQRAILATRDAKKPAESLDTLRTQWRSTADETVGSARVEAMLSEVRGRSRSAERPLFDPATHTDLVARQAMDTLSQRRARFRRSHVDTAVSTALKGYRFDSEDARRAAYSSVLHHAMTHGSVGLTPSEPLDLPARLRRTNGQGVDRRANSQRFTTGAVIVGEDAVLAAATEPVAVFAKDRTVRKAEKRFAKDKGYALNAGQKKLAEHLLQSGTLVASGVGPAGTGKTASMKVVADAWKAEGHHVIPLSTSAAAAEILGDDTGLTGRTIDSLTFPWRGRDPVKNGKDLSALPVTIGRGDMLLVDEAGMAGTDNLAAITEIAREAGAVVRLVGDPHQLDAVQTGGLFRDLARVPGTPMLDEVMRFGDDTAQAQASLELRDGHAEALELYNDRGWVTGGGRDAMLTEAAEKFLADTRAGKDSLVIAGRNDDVDKLNAMIRADRIDRGHIDTSIATRSARGESIAVGDTILARSNQKFWSTETRRDGTTWNRCIGKVGNGDLFTITGISDDGAVEGRRHGKTKNDYVVLPADYVADHVHLGYASTVHRSQGATVDTCHAVIDTSMDRAALYVAATRAKESTHLHAVTEFDPDIWAEDGHMHSAGDQWPSEPTAFLGYVLAHDRSQRSAISTLRAETDEAHSPDRLAALYRHGADIAADEFTAATLPTYIDRLPKTHGQLLEPGTVGGEIVADAWKKSVLHGVDPRDHWLAATDGLDAADDVAKLISWRLREHVPGHGKEEPTHPHAAPHTPGADTELLAWIAATRTTLASVPAERSMVTDRRVGRLTDTQLGAARTKNADRLAAARRNATAARDQLARARNEPATARVRARHADDDRLLGMLDTALTNAGRIRKGQDVLRQLAAERAQLTSENAQLGPLHRGKKSANSTRIGEIDRHARDVDTKVRAIADEQNKMRGYIGPEHTWATRRDELADAHRRGRELAEAHHADTRAVQQATDKVQAADERVARAERSGKVIDNEAQRREALTPEQRAAEHAERVRWAAEHPEPTTRGHATRAHDRERDLPPGTDIGPSTSPGHEHGL